MIRINDDYAIQVDQTNYVLVRLGTVTKKDSKNYGEETSSTVGFYSTLDNALYAAMREIQRDALMDGDMSLGEAVSEVRRISREMKEMLSSLVDDGK